MENGWRFEQKTLMSELIQGMELTKQLRRKLNAASSTETEELLIQGILSSYERALLMLNCGGSSSTSLPQTSGSLSGLPGNQTPANDSPRSDDFDRGLEDTHEFKDGSKKRKMMPRWTEQVRLNSENGMEGPLEDGFSWRKYGQKDILGARYPRSYYRCTYRNTQSCWATKQVQRSDEDPCLFEIIYRGKHTCSNGSGSVPPLLSPEDQDQRQNNNLNLDQNQQQNPQEILLSHQTNLRVDTDNLENKVEPPPSTFCFPSTTFGCAEISYDRFSLPPFDPNSDLLGGFPQPFTSPTTPTYTASPWRRSNFGGVHNGQQLESNIADIFSTNTSTSNSPIVDIEFSLDSAQFDTNFPFDTPGFFS